MSKTIPNLVGMQMYYIPPEIEDPEATPIYQNWDSNIIIDEVNNRTQYDSSTNPNNVLIYSWNMEYQEGLNPPNLRYFWIKNEDSQTINVKHYCGTGTVYYRIHPNETWTSWNYDTNISLNVGQYIEIKRDSTQAFVYEYKYQGFVVTGKISAGGNVMSLVYGDNFENQTVLTENNVFQHLLAYNHEKLIDISQLVLPATTLSPYCYSHMFFEDYYITSSPELPATTLANNCYEYMFDWCSRLAQAPELPATTLADYCYKGMFYNCRALTEAPELPATTLDDYCYNQMFCGCTGLTELPELPATTMVSGCYCAMFSGCTGLTEIPEFTATSLAENCFDGMFVGCTGITEAPELPYTTLAGGCYQYMFKDCTSLTVAPELPATMAEGYCYKGMFMGCTALTEAPELPATEIAYNCYQSMFEGCSSLVLAPTVLPAKEIKLDTRDGMFCYYQMFKDCTSLTTSPEIQLIHFGVRRNYYCFYRMFYNCSSLNYIKCLTCFDDNTINSLTEWVYGVAATGTFVKSDDNPNWSRGVNGIPSGWTVNSMVTPELFTKCFWIKNVDTNTFTVKYVNTYQSNGTLYYKLQGSGSWNTWASNTNISLAPNTSIYLMRTGVSNLNNAPMGNNTIGHITLNGQSHIGGNILSLIHGTGFFDQETIKTYYAFSNMFSNETNLIDASNLIMAPRTNEGCYQSMFYGCSNLIAAPKLPSWEPSQNSYQYMFSYCTSLTTAPDLLGQSLSYECYNNMFEGCSSLNYIKALFTSNPGTYSMSDWVKGVASTGTFVMNSEATWDPENYRGSSGVPAGWTVQTVSP